MGCRIHFHWLTTVTARWFFALVFPCLIGFGCGVENYSKPESICTSAPGGIPCGDIYTEDLIGVPEGATIEAIREYIVRKKNLKKSSPFRKIGNGKGDLNDLMRGLSVVKNAYTINPIFALALSALESGWGTSSMARNKYNLWGWNAIDGRERRAARFKSYSHGFNHVFARIKVMYLRTTGKYHRSCSPLEYFPQYVRRTGCPVNYCGASLAGMSCMYSSDPNWAKKVRSQMNDITNFINERCNKIRIQENPFPRIPSPGFPDRIQDRIRYGFRKSAFCL